MVLKGNVKGSSPFLTFWGDNDRQPALCLDHFELNVRMHGTMS